MISIVITAFKEPKTIATCIESVIKQKINEKYELIISAPDEKTLEIAKKYAKKNKKIKIIQDSGKGKYNAINKLLPLLKGKLFVFMDGDVHISQNSINELLKKFEDPKVGYVSGRPFPQENKSTKYGFWANFLFESAHLLRAKSYRKGLFFEGTGYLCAYKKGVISKLPSNVADDVIVPSIFWKKGFKISYADKAFVFVKNVDNKKDWFKQKIRTTKSHESINRYFKIPRKKTFLNEAKGAIHLFKYPQSIKEVLWVIELIIARLQMWGRVFFDTKIKKEGHRDAWERIESTK